MVNFTCLIRKICISYHNFNWNLLLNNGLFNITGNVSNYDIFIVLGTVYLFELYWLKGMRRESFYLKGLNRELTYAKGWGTMLTFRNRTINPIDTLVSPVYVISQIEIALKIRMQDKNHIYYINQHLSLGYFGVLGNHDLWKYTNILQ